MPFKNLFDYYILPIVHHSASLTSQMSTAATITGIKGPENLILIQNEINSRIRKLFNLEAVSYTNIKNDTSQ